MTRRACASRPDPVAGEADTPADRERSEALFRAAAFTGGASAAKTVVERSPQPFAMFALLDGSRAPAGAAGTAGGATSVGDAVVGDAVGDVVGDWTASPLPLAGHLALRTMCRNETASVICRSDYASGWAASASRGAAAAGRPIAILIELLDWEGSLSARDAVTQAGQSKARGGVAFAEMRWEASRACYSHALEVLSSRSFEWPPKTEEDATAAGLHIACLSNLTMCQLRLRQWERAAASATTVLSREPQNAKALYRRACASIERGEPHEAFADLKLALKLQPKSREVREAHARCRALVAAAASRERSFAGQLAAAIDGYHDDASADGHAAAAEAPAETKGPQLPGGDATTDEASAFYFENERTIADARMDGNEGNLVVDENDQRLQFRSMMEMGGTHERYAWGQSETELCVLIPVAAGTRAAHVRFELTSTHIRCARALRHTNGWHAPAPRHALARIARLCGALCERCDGAGV